MIPSFSLEAIEKSSLFLSLISFLFLHIFLSCYNIFSSSLPLSLSLYMRDLHREKGVMKKTIRCCISCILPCGALDVIRIVHSNGRVEEISGTIRASEIMKAHPKHVLKKPSTSPSDDGVVPKIVIVPPDAELQRGKIYFLIPVPASSTTDHQKRRSRSSTKKTRREHQQSQTRKINSMSNSISMTTNLLISDQYLSEILSENLSTQRDRRRGRVGVWRPHLESISESPSDI